MSRSPKEPSITPPESQFTRVAKIYDALMEGIAYDVWLRYVKSLWRKLKFSPKSILDVACGTGNVSFMLAAEGYQVVGIDYAPAMIEIAQSKQKRRNVHGFEANPTFLVQNAASIDLPMTFDAALSLFDSLNYLLEYDLLCDAFNGVFRSLNPGGVFIFDMNTIYALEKNFFNQDNLDMGIYPLYKWRSRWDASSKICTIDMEFQDLGAGGVEVFYETHRQRGYSIPEIRNGLLKAGFSDIEFLQAFSSRPPRARTDRIYVIAIKPS